MSWWDRLCPHVWSALAFWAAYTGRPSSTVFVALGLSVAWHIAASLRRIALGSR